MLVFTKLFSRRISGLAIAGAFVGALMASAAGTIAVTPPEPVILAGPEGGPFEPRFDVQQVTGAATSSAGVAASAPAPTANPLLARAHLLGRVRLPGPRGGERRLVLADFKHPRLLIETRGGADVVMAADHLLVQVRPGITRRAFEAVLAAEGCALKQVRSTPGCYLVTVPGDPLGGLDGPIARLSRHASVIASVSPDYIVTAAAVPNDPDFAKLYHLHNTGQTGGTPDADIDAVEAWQYSTGSPAILVGIVDTGIDYRHPDLAANVWSNPGEIPGNGLDDDGNGFVDDVHGWNFSRDTADPLDDNHHGTHVAGIVGALANNSLGVAGVAPQVRMAAIKFLDKVGNGTLADAVDATNYARRIGCQIINNSWRGYTDPPALRQEMLLARADGILVCSAAGNETGRNIDLQPVYPASYNFDNMLAVAATTHTDALASFSNVGVNTVGLAAPGSLIYSTWPGASGVYGYQNLSGTSMSTPVVSGAAVLVLARFPGYSPQQVIGRLLATVDRVPALAGKVYTGGRLNALQALVRPPPELLVLANPGPGAQSWTADADAPWIALSATSGTLAAGGTVTLTIGTSPAAAALDPGSYTASARIHGAGGLVGIRTVKLQVAGNQAGVLAVSPDEPFESQGPEGGLFAPGSKSYTISNTGDNTIEVAVDASAAWLTVSPVTTALAPGGGSTSGTTVRLTLTATTLTPGTYTTTVAFVNTTNGYGNATRTVTLKVTTPGVLAVTPAAPGSASGIQGGPFAPVSFDYAIHNEGESYLEWQIASNAAWLTAPAGTFLLAGDDTAYVSAAIGSAAQTLAAGTHTGTLTFTNLTTGLGNATRLVMLTVRRPGELAVSPGAPASFSGLAAGPFSPTALTMTVINTGEAAILWEIGGRPPWLSFAATSGTLEAGARYSFPVSVSPGEVPGTPGLYTADVQFTNLTNQLGSTSLNVALKVLLPAWLEVYPPSGFRGRGTAGVGASPATKTYTCRNTGEVTLQLRIDTDQGWLTTPAPLVALAPGESRFVPLQLSGMETLPLGVYSATAVFHNDSADQAPLERPAHVQLFEPGDTLIYHLRARGRRLTDTADNWQFGGYLVADAASQRLQAVLSWTDEVGAARYRVEDWTDEIALQQTFDDGPWSSHFVADLATVESPAGRTGWSSRQLEGRLRPQAVSSLRIETVPWFLRGRLYQSGDDPGSILEARLYARLDNAGTAAANDLGSSLETSVSSLAETLETAGATLDGGEPPATPAAVPAPPPAAVLVYTVSLNLKINTDEGRRLVRRRGYLVIGGGSSEGRLIVYTTGREGKHAGTFETDALLTQVQTGRLASRQVAMLAHSGDWPATRLQVLRLVGREIPSRTLGTGAEEAVPRWLRGTWWQDDTVQRLHADGSVYARLDTDRTRLANSGNTSPAAVVNGLLNDLLAAGWTPDLE